MPDTFNFNTFLENNTKLLPSQKTDYQDQGFRTVSNYPKKYFISRINAVENSGLYRKLTCPQDGSPKVITRVSNTVRRFPTASCSSTRA